MTKMAAMTGRSTMSPIAQWIVWFGLGGANALLMGIGGVMLVVVLLALSARVVSRGDAISALSGLLVGFGTAWLALMARQATTGGQLVDSGPWLALGIASALLGGLLGALRLVRWVRAAT
jgi:uncharacterized membrane protein